VPLPMGHAAIGLTTYGVCNSDEPILSRWKVFAGVVVLSNLPDIDILVGLLVRGNGNAFHRGPTHSLLFALTAGLLAANAWRLWPKAPRFGFATGFLVTLSHVLADALLTQSQVSFLWPLSVNWSHGHMGWHDLIGSVLLGSFRDFEIVAACGLFLFLYRWTRGFRIFERRSRTAIVSKVRRGPSSG